MKHVALNDSEISRRGVTWLTEQAAREIYLEVADWAIIDGGAWCVMSGFNRWGAQWSGENYNLQTAYLRGECGMLRYARHVDYGLLRLQPVYGRCRRPDGRF